LELGAKQSKHSQYEEHILKGVLVEII